MHEKRQAQSIAAPPTERRIVRRARLLEQLDGVVARTVLLAAPAGYGKTTLARQWLEHTGGAWLGITAASCDIPVLARDLAAAVADLSPIELRRVETALKAAPAPLDQARAVARVILAQVASPVEGWLVVDDYHLLIPNPAAEELIGTLEKSGRFKLLLTSRERPTWATSRRRVYLDLFELGAADLALDDEEVSALLPPGRRTAALRKQARGWPAAIGLAAYSELSEVPLSPDALTATLYDYLAEELFERASPSVQLSLTAIALLPPLEADDLTEFLATKAAATPVLSTGLAYETDGRIEVHPLARAFLLAKLRTRPDANQLVRKSIDLAMSKERWDEAFELIREFGFDDRMEELITASLPSLIETGRIATLDTFGLHAAARGCVPHSLLDLIAAEVALRDGLFDRAYALSECATARFADNNPLKARALIVSGRAAYLNLRYDEAFNLHTRAMQTAIHPTDFSDSAWGRCLAALTLEDDRVNEAVEEFEAISALRTEDRLRVLYARLCLGALSGGIHDLSDRTEEARLMSTVTDPWARTAWSHGRGYCLVLQGRYDEARIALLATLDDASESGLLFARWPIEASLAAAELGLRHFGRCNLLLRRIEHHLDRSADLVHALNARALHARLHLAQQHPRQALDLTRQDFAAVPHRAIYGEYVATRALALAITGFGDQAIANASRAERLTAGIQTRLLCEAARLVVGQRDPGASEAAEAFLESAQRLNVWDPVVCVARAVPGLAADLAAMPDYRTQLSALFVQSRDNALAKAVGLGGRTYGPRGLLSPREREVLDLVSAGMRNSEIGEALFISPATVKAHVRSISEKLGTRTRAESVARYAEIETGSDTGS